MMRTPSPAPQGISWWKDQFNSVRNPPGRDQSRTARRRTNGSMSLPEAQDTVHRRNTPRSLPDFSSNQQKERGHRCRNHSQQRRRHPLPQRRDLHRRQCRRDGPQARPARTIRPFRSSPSRKGTTVQRVTINPTTKHDGSRDKAAGRAPGSTTAGSVGDDQRRRSTATAMSARRGTPRRAGCMDRSPTTCWTPPAIWCTTMH